MSFVLTIAAASAAVGVEMLEALAIILAVGMTCGFRPALFGAAAAVVGVVLLCLALGPALIGGADLNLLRVLIGGLLLLFGLEWLRKGILRMAGRRRRSSSYDEFVEHREALGGESTGQRGDTWAAGLVAFKGVFLEGLEVGLIVIALGASPERLTAALLGTAFALAFVCVIGLTLHRPLRRLPETQLKLGVGVALTTFGTFFAAEGLNVHWPLDDLALLYLLVLFGATAWLATLRLKPAFPVVETT